MELLTERVNRSRDQVGQRCRAGAPRAAARSSPVQSLGSWLQSPGWSLVSELLLSSPDPSHCSQCLNTTEVSSEKLVRVREEII